MSEREDWFADAEGNLTGPGEDAPRPELKPDTDEFGRDDPAALERERRRREREERRRGGSKGSKPGRGKKAPKRGAGERGGLLGGLRRRREPASEEVPPPERAPRPERTPRPQQAPRPEQTAPAQQTASPEPAARPRRGRPAPVASERTPPTEGRPAATGVRAAASERRDALRQRLARRGGGDEPPAGAGGTGGFRRRRAIAIAAAVLGLLFVWFLVAFFQPFAGDGQGEGRLAVDIPAGSSAGDVAELLAEEGVVSNATLFEWRLKLSGKSGELISGLLPMAEGMSYGAAIDRLTGETKEEGTLVMPEGYSREQYAPILAEAGIEGDYLAATESFKGFDPAKYGAKNPPNLEGFLFPATYELLGGETVDDIVEQQLAAFEANIKSADLSFAKKKNLTPYDVLIIASMIDREVQVDKERPLVAAVIYNRLSMGEPLGIDATTRYEYNNWTDAITQAQLDKDTPFNTRLNAGLTPTPIGSPGLASIEAAARPAKVDYLFYVVKPGTCPAEHAFTNSEAEFTKLVAQYNEARSAAGNESPTC